MPAPSRCIYIAAKMAATRWEELKSLVRNAGEVKYKVVLSPSAHARSHSPHQHRSGKSQNDLSLHRALAAWCAASIRADLGRMLAQRIRIPRYPYGRALAGKRDTII